VTLFALLRMRIQKGREGKKERSREQETEEEAHENKMKMEGEESEQECMAKSGEDTFTVSVAYMWNIASCTAAVASPRGPELNIVHITLTNVTASNVRVALDWYT